MNRKQLLALTAVALVAGMLSFAAGYAASPDSSAHLLARGADEWTALAAWIALVIATVGAAFAAIQAQEARRIRIEQAQPQIVAYLEPDPEVPWAVQIVIANFGTTAARDVKVSTDVPVRAAGGPDRNSTPTTVAIPSRFPTLAPGQHWRTVWDWSPYRSEHTVLANEKRVTFYFDYDGVDGKPVHNESDLDWSEIHVRSFVERKTLTNVANELVKVRRVLERRPRPGPIAHPQPVAAPPAPPTPPKEGRVARLYRHFTRASGA